jgi:hypothetical protein
MSKPEITFSISIEEDDLAVKGNAMASGDDAFDKEVEEGILDRLRRGDTWAWACVTVFAKCQGYEGRAILGGCSYNDEEDFKKGGYYEDMMIEAREDLFKSLEREVSQGEKAVSLLRDLQEAGER